MLFADTPLTMLLGLALLAAACAGHAVLVIASHNFFYGNLRNRHLIDGIQLLHALILAAGPVLFWFSFGLDPGSLFPLSSADLPRAALALYAVACWYAGGIHFPVLSLWRHLRSRPTVLVSNHNRVVDVAAKLGTKPLGNGTWRFLARLPYNEVFTVDLVERTLRLPRLPRAWDGLSILQLTDFHLCGTPDREYFRVVMDHCAQWDPDIVAFTGDLVDTEKHHRWIIPLMGRLRWRLFGFAILGNHDWYFDPPVVRRRLARVGFHVLGNRWHQVELRGEPLIVMGHEGPWFTPEPDLSSCPKGPFRLCLSHTPDNIRWAQAAGVDLMLAGHVHGGQVQFPGIGPVVIPSKFGRRYACGTFYEPPTVMHVGRGLGGEQPLRYNCRPEVTRLILRCAEG